MRFKYGVIKKRLECATESEPYVPRWVVGVEGPVAAEVALAIEPVGDVEHDGAVTGEGFEIVSV